MSAGARAIPVPRAIDAPDCGCDRVIRREDGLTTAYYCAACGDLVAEIIVGAEP